MSKASEMPSKYNHEEIEPKIYKKWVEMGAFSPEKSQELREKHDLENKDESYSILMPPPNANAPLHCGHATYAIQDVMARIKRMQGYKTLYLPGTDHAGFETQVVYERKLKEQGKSRLDFDRQTLFNDILSFVQENSEVAVNQLEKIGMSADWDRHVFMLQDNVLNTVYNTFEKMHNDNLVYRDVYLVNYSPHHGTTFSNLETEHIETTSPLYYVKYQIDGSDNFITVATVRPETIFADTAIAVNPKDERYKNLVGKVAINPLNGKELPIIADSRVDEEFGTGALKITPGHDFTDFEIGKEHELEMISAVDLDGNMANTNSEVDGLPVKEARKKTAEYLQENGSIEKIDENYTHNLLVDYKDNRPIEPMLLPNWFIKMDGLAEKAKKAIKDEKVSFNRNLWKKEILRWLENIHDWPISRQIVFGIRIPAWYEVTEESDLFVVFLDEDGKTHEGQINKILSEGFTLDQIKDGLQKVIAPVGASYTISQEAPGKNFIQETDTFDTWFSSGQWPLTTLNYPDGKDFKEFFPTSFMDTMWDILFFWIARMIMFSLYLVDDVPFKDVYVHGRIDDEKGQKMSKSKGNVIDPLEFVEEFGADALRMGILVGGNTAARTTSFSPDKVRGYRNFSNKIWNMARFMLIMEDKYEGEVLEFSQDIEDKLNKEDKRILGELKATVENVNESLEKFRFKDMGDSVYHFLWDEVADKYIEHVKDREDKDVALSVLKHVFSEGLKILHPFMPFVTEEIWSKINDNNSEPLIISNWPE